MKKLFLFLMIIPVMAFGEAPYRVMKYHDCASASITNTTWTTCTTVDKRANALSVLNNGNANLIVCLADASSACTTTNQEGLNAGQGMAKDKFPVSTNIYLKGISGTCSSGIVSCGMWRQDQ